MLRPSSFLALCHAALQLILLLSVMHVYALPKNYKMHVKGAYVGYVGRQNMGDELVLDIFAHVLADTLRQQASFVNSTPEIVLDYDKGGVLQIQDNGQPRANISWMRYEDMTGMDFMVFGGGSLLEPVRNMFTRFCVAARLARLPIYIHATGTQLPANATQADMTTLDCIRTVAYGGLRGPITAAMLQDLAAEWARKNPGAHPNSEQPFDLNLPIISDSGMLAGQFFPRESADVVKKLDRNTSSAGVICISGAHSGLNFALFVRTMSTKYNVVLMPIDHLTYLLMSKFYDKLIRQSPELSDRLFVSKYVTDYGVWLALLDRCSLMLTSRLHAIILSASAQTRFRIFDEPGRNKLKKMDFLNNTFGEALEAFMVPSEFRGTLAEVDRMLTEDTAAWQRRYDVSYRQREIVKPYSAHVTAMAKFVNRVLPEGALQEAQGVRITVDRCFNGAAVHLRLW